VTTPSWQFRVSLTPGPDAPRATLPVTLRTSAKGNTAARVTLPNGQRLRVVAFHDLQADAIQRLGRRLAERGWTIWHLSPPGEAMPEDDRPAMTAGRMEDRDLPTITASLQWLEAHAPALIVALGREAVLGGAAAHVGTIHGGTLRWVSLTLIGATLSPTLKKRLTDAGFSRDTVAGHARYYWTDAPRPAQPVRAPASDPMPTTEPSGNAPALDPPKRGRLRLVPTLPKDLP
jgi:hypothetical protein